MGYIQDNLMGDEQVVYAARLHWIIFGPTMVAGLILLGDLAVPDDPPMPEITAVWVALTVLLGVGAFIKGKTSEFAVTDKRVIAKVGLVRRNTIEMLLQKVETINVSQGILGRILGYGTVTIVGAGGTKEVFKHISTPLRLRKSIQEQATAIGG